MSLIPDRVRAILQKAGRALTFENMYSLLGPAERVAVDEERFGDVSGAHNEQDQADDPSAPIEDKNIVDTLARWEKRLERLGQAKPANDGSYMRRQWEAFATKALDEFEALKPQIENEIAAIKAETARAQAESVRLQGVIDAWESSPTGKECLRIRSETRALFAQSLEARRDTIRHTRNANLLVSFCDGHGLNLPANLRQRPPSDETWEDVGFLRSKCASLEIELPPGTETFDQVARFVIEKYLPAPAAIDGTGAIDPSASQPAVIRQVEAPSDDLKLPPHRSKNRPRSYQATTGVQPKIDKDLGF